MNYRELCQQLCQEVEARLAKDGRALETQSWQVGRERLFMKEDLERTFERLLGEAARGHVLTIQKQWRGAKGREQYAAMKAAKTAGLADAPRFATCGLIFRLCRP